MPQKCRETEYSIYPVLTFALLRGLFGSHRTEPERLVTSWGSIKGYGQRQEGGACLRCIPSFERAAHIIRGVNEKLTLEIGRYLCVADLNQSTASLGLYASKQFS